MLIAGDQDFVPLIRKVNGIGTRVMLLGMDVKYKDSQSGKDRWINTSQLLVNEASYPVLLNAEIDSRTAKGDRIIDGLFSK